LASNNFGRCFDRQQRLYRYGSAASEELGYSVTSLKHFIDRVYGQLAIGTPYAQAGDPHLAPLADNGGPVLTHALLSGSPAINRGINPDGLATDQRGAGYARIVGNFADIGAYELQMGDGNDKIFSDGFD
jgi:hypothetical protein